MFPFNHIGIYIQFIPVFQDCRLYRINVFFVNFQQLCYTIQDILKEVISGLSNLNR